ncbi:MAG: hypothetical protein IT545_09155 [Rhodobacteraceae bacterium]|nr:hypothetical protein [Paracoccaceae bacterium]
MRVLVCGNSQAGALFRAVNAGPAGAEVWPHFFVIPGGDGPALRIRPDLGLEVTHSNPRFPPYHAPAATAGTRLSDYDAIVVSALGWVDGGFMYENPITRQGAVAEFGPRPGEPFGPLISQATQLAVLRQGLAVQPGVVFLRALARVFRGPVLVQPFPYPSEEMKERTDWQIREWYRDFLGMHRFLQAARDAEIARLCAECGATLLAHADPAWSADCFSPRAFIAGGDGLHPTAAFGALVLGQIRRALGLAAGDGAPGAAPAAVSARVAPA